MAHGKYWTAAEDAIITRCWASGSTKPEIDAADLLRCRKVISIQKRAWRLGLKKSKPVPVVREDVAAPARRHRGHVRPVLCPHCAGIVVVPADPRAR